MSKYSHHVVSVSTYLLVLFALLFLTFITVAVTFFDAGSLNIVIAMVVAFIKASLVIGFFMGLHWERGFIAVFFLASLLAIFLFFLFVFSDLSFRGFSEPLESQTYGFKTSVKMVEKAATHIH